jgi:hypothetical protein
MDWFLHKRDTTVLISGIAIVPRKTVYLELINSIGPNIEHILSGTSAITQVAHDQYESQCAKDIGEDKKL